MRALVMTDHHELRLMDLPDPEITRPDEALIRVEAAGVCGSDLHGYTGASGRRRPPLIMGHEAAGVVLATGAGVTDPAPGTRVAIYPIVGEGAERRLMGMDAPGAYATRVVWPAAALHPLPDAVSFEAGSLAEPLGVALHAVAAARMDVPADARVLVVGAGPIGLLVTSVLRSRGVGRIAVSDLSPERLAVARELGVDTTIDATAEDPREAIGRMTGGEGVDVAFEAVGVGAAVAQAHDAVRYGGTVVWIGNNQKRIDVDMQQVVTRELTIRGSYGMSRADFAEALELLADGAVRTDLLIDRRADLAEGPTLFDELLASPGIVKCVIAPSSPSPSPH